MEEEERDETEERERKLHYLQPASTGSNTGKDKISKKYLIWVY